MAKTDFRTPKLRLLQGDCFEAQTKNMQGQPLVDKQGNPTQRYFIAAGGRKGDPEVEAFKAKIETEGRTAFPHLFTGPGGACTHPAFSSKIIDGDGFDGNGKPNANKEGFAGHWVFKFGSTYAPRCFAAGRYDETQRLGPVPGIPRGNYIRVAGTMEGNGDAMKPGIYVNLNMIEFTESGPLIISGPDAASVFGGAPAAAVAPPPAAAVAPPPGAVAPPPAAAGPIYTMLPAAGGVSREAHHAQGWTDDLLVQHQKMAITMPAAAAVAPPPAAVAPPPHVPVAPHPGILAPAPQPLGGSAPTAPPAVQIAAAAPGFRMANPAGHTYAAYIAQGWTDAALAQNGHMVAL